MERIKKELIETPSNEIHSFIYDFPGLIWQIETAKAKIKFLNSNSEVAYGIDGKFLMKNFDYRNNVILPEDYELMEFFMESVKASKNAEVVLRVKDRNDSCSWIKLLGWVNPHNDKFYTGYIQNIDFAFNSMKGLLGNDIELGLLIEDSENPVLLIDYDSAIIIKSNKASNKLFKLKDLDSGYLKINNLVCSSMDKIVSSFMKEIPVKGIWTGSLELQSDSSRTIIESDAVARFFIHRGSKYIRLKLSNFEKSRKGVSSSCSIHHKDLEDSITGVKEIGSILDLCIQNPFFRKKCDGLMFSDINIRKDMVTVYCAGDIFSGMERSSSFSYKGTIAEDINRYNLEYLAVDDTQDSIKPIDWALFIPKGIRSYYAVPFYSRKVLRTVLILCSTKACCFEDKLNPELYELFNIINNSIKEWRRNLRK